jgi:hypothetical protein
MPAVLPTPDTGVPVDATLPGLRGLAKLATFPHSFLQLPEGLFLRASDCIHLADEIYNHDVRQTAAAEALGLVAVRIE